MGNSDEQKENEEGEDLICAPIQVIIPVVETSEEESEEEEEVKKKKRKKKPNAKKIKVLTSTFMKALRIINEEKVISLMRTKLNKAFSVQKQIFRKLRIHQKIL